MDFDSTVRQFLEANKNKYFTKTQFMDYIKSKNKDLNSAEYELNTLIKESYVKKFGRNKYKVIKSF